MYTLNQNRLIDILNQFKENKTTVDLCSADIHYILNCTLPKKNTVKKQLIITLRNKLKQVKPGSAYYQ